MWGVPTAMSSDRHIESSSDLSHSSWYTPAVERESEAYVFYIAATPVLATSRLNSCRPDKVKGQ